MAQAIERDPFRALADPTRREILQFLRRGPRPVRELAARFPQMSRPAVSKHLRILRQAGLASETRDGRRRIYRLEVRALDDVKEWLSEIERRSPGEAPEPAPVSARPSRRKSTRRSAGGRRAATAAAAAKRRVASSTETESEPKGEEVVIENGGDWKSW